jgi:hypothetical protein
MASTATEWLTTTFEPIWQTPIALAKVLGVAEAGTMLAGLFLVIASLELLRSSGPFLSFIARLLVVAAGVFFGATFFYGDFMAAPAKAAYSLIGMSETRHNTMLFTTLGAAGVTLVYQAGRRSANTRTKPETATERFRARMAAARSEKMGRISELGRTLALDTAGRIQLRQLTYNAKKATVTVRAGGRMLPSISHTNGSRRSGWG